MGVYSEISEELQSLDVDIEDGCATVTGFDVDASVIMSVGDSSVYFKIQSHDGNLEDVYWERYSGRPKTALSDLRLFLKSRISMYSKLLKEIGQ